ncbi:unnamed protein product [Urochloa decumbens]|uniref:Uncharacterized protein n=1 Tax=Urochloa decumbens TaxID=240449 RepID=A0ABC9EJ21_9POAL
MRQAPPHMVPWTEEEDATLNLKAMVDMCTGSGSGRWCPAGSGSSAASAGPTTCAPTSTSWTEADDLKLITAHKVFGNRWSLIARELDGRSENSVKNHWNATKRSLKAKRRLKKKKNAEAPLGQQWSILEQYIRSISPEAGAAAAAATVTVGDPAEPAVASDSPPSSYDTGYDGEVVSPPAPAVAAPPPHAAGFDPTAMGLYLNASGNNYSSSAAAAAGMGAMNMNPDMAPPPYLGLDLNCYYYYGGAAMQAAPPMMQMMGQGQQHHAAAASSTRSWTTWRGTTTRRPPSTPTPPTPATTTPMQQATTPTTTAATRAPDRAAPPSLLGASMWTTSTWCRWRPGSFK